MSNPLHEQDRDLVAAVLRNDAAARDELARRLECVPVFVRSRFVRAACTFDEDDVADVVQDVMVTLLGKLHEFRGEARLETWAYRFCDFVVRNAVRGKRRRAAVYIGVEADDVAAEDRPEDALDASLILELLAELDDDGAAIVRAKHFDDLTFDQIASRSGRSINTVKSKFYRLLEQLRGRLQTLSEGGSDG